MIYAVFISGYPLFAGTTLLRAGTVTIARSDTNEYMRAVFVTYKSRPIERSICDG